MASFFYGNGIKALLTGQIDVDTDTIKGALTTASYTPNADTDDFFSDVTNEVSGTGYTAGGKALTTVSVTVDAANNRVYIDADDLFWASSTITDARYLVLYKDTGTAATSPLLLLVDLGGNKSTTGDTFYIEWAAAASGGFGYITY